MAGSLRAPGLGLAVLWHLGVIFLLAALLCAISTRAARTKSMQDVPKRSQARSAWRRFASFAALTPVVFILVHLGPLPTAFVFLTFILLGLSEFWQIPAARGIVPYRRRSWILAVDGSRLELPAP